MSLPYIPIGFYVKKENKLNYPRSVEIYDYPLSSSIVIILIYVGMQYTLTLKDSEENFSVRYGATSQNTACFLYKSDLYPYFKSVPQYQIEMALKGKAMFTNIKNKVEFCKINQNKFNKTQSIKTTSNFEIDIYED